MAVTFDLFGTLVAVDRSEDPEVSVATTLRDRGVAVPDNWSERYTEQHIEAPSGAEVPLPAHVAAALRAGGVDAPASTVRRAVVAAFDPEVRTRPGADAAVSAAAARGPVGLLSNCSVPELVPRTLIRSTLDRSAFDATVTSIGCGWRKPHPKAFETVAGELGVDAEALVHVGDDDATDSGVEAVGGAFLDVDEVGLNSFADRLRAGDQPASLAEGSPCR
ncbi:MAG: HAD family hydrolase [Halobellus sp.]|uniref:HAD family hydrolase n=1 Tax=Halobellus sp. TaxID=1979212 RepID=UPI0035D44829